MGKLSHFKYDTGTTNYFFRGTAQTFDIPASVSSITAGNQKFSIYVEYIAALSGDPPVASFTCDHTFLRIPQPVTCTDTSTETPTSWLWDFGDGTTSTDENPVHKYTRRGVFDVTLTATNADGSDESDITEMKVIGYDTHT